MLVLRVASRSNTVAAGAHVAVKTNKANTVIVAKVFVSILPSQKNQGDDHRGL